MDIYLAKTDQGALIPAWNNDHELLKRIKVGEVRKYKVTKPRNLKFHKKFFALIRCAMFHIPEELKERFPSQKVFLNELKLQTGHYELHVDIDGNTMYIPDSINFASMDDFQFSEFYSRCLDVILKKYMQGMSQATFENEVMGFL